MKKENHKSAHVGGHFGGLQSTPASMSSSTAKYSEMYLNIKEEL